MAAKKAELPEGDAVQLNIRRFPLALRKEFHILCIQRAKSMTEEIIRLIAEEVDTAKKSGEL